MTCLSGCRDNVWNYDMAHYFENTPADDERIEEFDVRVFGTPFHFISASGMFSVGKLDRGAEVLIDNALIATQDTVLDLGCSYGVVGICIAKHYGAIVTMVDINERAVRYANKNISRNNVTSLCTALVSDGFTRLADKKFKVILFNPPQHAGKELCLRLIGQAKQHLLADGSLQVVARHNVGGQSFEKHMRDTFGNVEVLARKSGYRVYRSVNEG